MGIWTWCPLEDGKNCRAGAPEYEPDRPQIHLYNHQGKLSNE
jgi:hypothetical protein